MTWYRGSNGHSSSVCGMWYAADPAYAAFFGSVDSVELELDRVLDLRGLGVGDSDDETFLRVERLSGQLAQRYDAVRVMQWHADYSAEPQDTLLVL